MIQCTKGQLSQADWGPWEAGSRSWATLQTQACLYHMSSKIKEGLARLSQWQVRKTAQQPTVKTLCPWEQGKVNHLWQRWPVFTTGKIPTSEGKFSLGQTIYAEKAHLGSTADCLNFPSGFLLDVASLRLGISYVYYPQLLHCHHWTQWNPNVMICCQVHASLYLLPDILLLTPLTHSRLHTWPFTDRSLDHT